MSATIEKQVPEEAMVTKRLWTIADLAALPHQLPSGPAVYELWEGELRLMPPMGDVHGNLELRIGTLFTIHGEWEGVGRPSGGDVGVVLKAEEPATVVGADVVFFTADQQPVQHSKEGYLLTIPALLVEVRSKNDTVRELEAKAAAYLSAGTQVVWICDPSRETVTVYRSGQEPQVLRGDDTLTSEMLPSLNHPIRELFKDLGK